MSNTSNTGNVFTNVIPSPEENAEWRLQMFTRRCYDAVHADPTCNGGKAIHVEIVDIENELVDELIARLCTDGYRARRRTPGEGTHPYLLIFPSDPYAAAIEQLTLKCIDVLHKNWTSVDIAGVENDVVDAVIVKLRAAGWAAQRRPLSEGTHPLLQIRGKL